MLLNNMGVFERGKWDYKSISEDTHKISTTLASHRNKDSWETDKDKKKKKKKKKQKKKTEKGHIWNHRRTKRRITTVEPRWNGW